MSKRKTIEISKLVEMANGILQHSGADCVGIRQGTMNLVEAALFETKNYKGFRYLDETEVSADSLPGIRDTAISSTRGPDNFKDTDRTRIHYFYS
jgi:hypothetical protein